MKKISLILATILLLVSLFSLTACGAKLEGELTDYVKQIYTTAEMSKENKEYFASEWGPAGNIHEIEADRIAYYLGCETEFIDAVYSEAMMSTVAYLLVLIRVDEKTDIEALKTKIKQNAPRMKWVCVGVEEDEVYVENVGNVIMLLMCNFDCADALVQAFLALK